MRLHGAALESLNAYITSVGTFLPSMQFLSYDLGCFTVGIRYLSHGLALPDPESSVVLEIVIEEIQQNRIFLKLMQLVNAESVHVVIDFDDLFALCTPISFNLFS